MTEYFNKYEDIAYSVIETIPGVGTLYSFIRGSYAGNVHDDKELLASLNNGVWGLVRNIVLVGDLIEPTPVVLIHGAVEALTDKLIEVYATPNQPQVTIKSKIDKSKGHVVFAGANPTEIENFAKKLFKQTGVKGLYHYYRSVFLGTIAADPKNPHPVKDMTLLLRDGFVDGAPATFMWHWAKDPQGKANTIDYSHGKLKVKGGTPVQFEVTEQTGKYKLWGTTGNAKYVFAKLPLDGRTWTVAMTKLTEADLTSVEQSH